MLPLKLTIEGLYSYQERQVIDFENLTAAGLFGIFGETGSGKSSILEAITLALYGESARLTGTYAGSESYNLMNLKSDTLYLEFIFKTGDNKTYKTVRRYGRNRNNFDDVNLRESTIYEEIAPNNWEPVSADLNISEIIGINYNNFRRTIIIPQGYFKEFIDLTPGKRTGMLKEIFDLDRFDLHYKVKELNSENLSQFDQITGELNAYDHITEEVLSEQQNLEKEAKEKLEKSKTEFKTLDEQFQSLKSQKSDFDNLSQKREDLAKKEEKSKEIEQKEKEIKQFEQIATVFTPLLDSEKSGIEKKTKLTDEISIKSKELEGNQQELIKNEEKLKEIEEYFQKITQKRQEEKEYDAIKEALIQIQKIKQIQNESKALKEQQEELQKRVVQGKKDIGDLENEIEKLDEQKMNPELILQIEKWYFENKNYQTQLQKYTDDHRGVQEKRTVELQKLESFSIDLSSFNEVFSEKEKALQEELSQAKTQLQQLEVHQKLSEYAHTLEDGSPCPLCGSEEHPNVQSGEDVSGKISEWKEKMDAVEEKLTSLQRQKVEVETVRVSIEHLDNQAKDLTTQIEKVKTSILEAEKQFVWKDFDKNDESIFQAKKKENSKILQETEENHRKLRENRSKLNKIEEKSKINEENLQKFIIEETRCNSTKESNLKSLSNIKWEDYQHFPIEEVEEKRMALKDKNDTIEKNYREFSKNIGELRPKVAELNAEVKGLKSQFNEVTEELQKVQEKIQSEIEKTEFSLDEIKTLLASTMDVEGIKSEIQQFKIDVEALKKQIQELEQKTKESDYNPEKFAEIEQKHAGFVQNLEEITKNHTKLEAEVKRISEELKKKNELQKVKEKFEKRAENLRTLLNLFSSAGFVNYISSIYLQQLCDIANVRFSRMTKGQLQLILNDKNEFEIIDYLNEGRVRSVKTLSGGQAFQVSLSLALALAESVQSKFKTDRNFFFIDEGFGTQDGEAVNLVFETLLSLNKENKVVGIISHVDELKERMPYSLYIKKDEERGSIIYQD